MSQKWAMAACLLEGPVGRTLRPEGFHRHPTFSLRFVSTLFFLSTSYSPTNIFSSMPCASTLEQRPSYPDITFPHWIVSPRLGGTWNYFLCVHLLRWVPEGLLPPRRFIVATTELCLGTGFLPPKVRGREEHHLAKPYLWSPLGR